MHADFRHRENICKLEMTFALVVLIEMIVLKHAICPNNIENERLKILSGKLFNHFLKPLYTGNPSKPNFLSGLDKVGLEGFSCICLGGVVLTKYLNRQTNGQVDPYICGVKLFLLLYKLVCISPKHFTSQ